MKTFDEIIVQLIIQHDCVVIPEFGGFVTKAIPSKIDYDKGIMSPPSKQLLFNIQLLNNDGLLTTEISSVNKTSYADASNEIIRKVSEYNTVLKEGKKITIHKVGTFQRNQEGVIIFEQDRFFNFLMASYGLDNIQFVPAKEITKEIILTPRKSNKWKYAAAACLFPIAFYSFWIPLKTNVLSSKMISIHDLNPFHKANKINYIKIPLKSQKEKLTTNSSSIEEQYKQVDLSSDFWCYQYDEETSFTVRKEQEVVPIKIEEPISDNTEKETEIINLNPSTYN
jgi:nucleoid DNA-binding protein